MDNGILYLCATPIGNLDDITVRCLETLKQSDVIACEDTRHSLKLLNHFGIKKPLVSYYEHNKKEKGEYIISLLKEGKIVSLVTDAGTPAISDPGEDLVKMCMDIGIRVIPIPGCVAFVNALIISGQSTKRISFEGFLSVNKKSRSEHLLSVKDLKHTLIFYEAPHKIKKTLSDMREVLGNRSISIIKELTKVYENAWKTTFDEAISFYEENIPKGEFVLVIEGAKDEDIVNENLSMTISEHINMLISRGIDKKEAIKMVAANRKLSKRDVYNEYEREKQNETP